MLAAALLASITGLVNELTANQPQFMRSGVGSIVALEASGMLGHLIALLEKYRTEMLLLLGAMLLQGGTIAALFVQHRRKRRLESELALERLELSYLSRTCQLGELSGALAHELNQPLTSILANAEAARSLLDKTPLDLEELHAIVEDIVLDDKRAAGVIAQLRSLMIRGESRLDPMDLNEAINTTLTLARSEMLARQTQVDATLDIPHIQIHGNLAQLQQVVLNLILNAADAMADLPPSSREIVIETRNRGCGLCELTVTDCGAGIDPERQQDIFKPFVSTKKASLGLGLAICRSIVQAHGGTLRFDERMKRGARAILVLPMAGEEAS
jgi:C4-dicarboxylate-specific signal transduction histidine kinase